jgi:TPR repeat protein
MQKMTSICVIITWLLLSRIGGEENFKNAVAYFKLGANANDPASQYQLAQAYENGFGIEQSYEEAYKFYQLAANQEIVEAFS